MTATIINLSSLIAMPKPYLERINTVIDALSVLCKKYNKPDLCHAMLFANSFGSKAWLLMRYLNFKPSIIDPYKLGDIDTEQFLNKLLEQFSFLKDVELDEQDKQALGRLGPTTWAYQHNVANKEAKALLELAWNDLIKLDDKYLRRISNVVDSANRKNPVFLIANTNELNIHHFLYLLRENGYDLKQSLDTSLKHQKQPLEVLPNVFLCLSYQYHASKLSGQLDDEATEKDPMLKQVIVHDAQGFTHGDMMQLCFVSDYPAEQNVVSELGVPKINIKSSEEYFQGEKVFEKAQAVI